MINPMTTARPQHRYDHRLRELVHHTEDVTIATDLGVARSTARGWLRRLRSPGADYSRKTPMC
jgi:transposase